MDFEQPQEPKSVLGYKKNKSEIFDFLLAPGLKYVGDHFVNDFTGNPKTILIGKYGKNGYEFNHVKSIVSLELEVDFKSKTCRLDTGIDEIDKNTQVFLPIQVISILETIPQSIKHNIKSSEDDENEQGNNQNNNYNNNQNNKNKNNAKITEYFKKEQKTGQGQQKVEKPEEGSDEEKEEDMKMDEILEKNKNNKQQNKKGSQFPPFNPFQFKVSNKILFTWTINTQNKSIQVDLKNQNVFMNIVLHPRVFQELNFEKTKRIVKNIPICMVIPDKLKSTANVERWHYDDKNINFNELRSEYLSTHLQGYSLCFSPNNMKFEVYPEKAFWHFWTIILQQSGVHEVNYFWNINEHDDIEILEDILRKSQSLEHLFANFLSIYGDDDPLVAEINRVFNFCTK